MWTCSLVVLLILFIQRGITGDSEEWRKDAIIYRLLVNSFKDSDGDGLGDIAGATKQLSYIRALGSDAVLVSPLYAMSTNCKKPGVVDPTNIDGRYGSLSHLSEFLEKAKKLEITALIELPLQTTSEASDWFTASENKTLGFEDWIVWKVGSTDEAPETVPGIDSWTWNENRNAYWATRDNEAVINICSDGVKAAFAAAQCAWIRRGFAGILLRPDFTIDQACSEQLIRKLAASSGDCARSSNLEPPLIFVESDLMPDQTVNYYGGAALGAHSVLSNALTSPTKPTSPQLALKIQADILYAPSDLKATWATSRLSYGRIATRYGSDTVDAINLLTLILPGPIIIQQGDELGAADTLLEWSTSASDVCRPSKPMPAAVPFAWDESMNGGFTSGESWLPLSPNYRYANAKVQFSSDSSHAAVVRAAAAMRKSPANGPHAEITRIGDALAVLRWGGTGSLLLICNLGSNPTEVAISKIPGLPHELIVATSSASSSAGAGSHVAVDKSLKLIPGEAILMAGAPRHCGGPGPVDKIASKLNEGWQKINKYFSSK